MYEAFSPAAGSLELLAVRELLSNLLIGLLDDGLLDLGDDLLIDKCLNLLADPIALRKIFHH